MGDMNLVLERQTNQSNVENVRLSRASDLQAVVTHQNSEQATTSKISKTFFPFL